MKKIVTSLVTILAMALFLHGCAAKEESAGHEDMAGNTATLASGDFYEDSENHNQGKKLVHQTRRKYGWG